MSNVFWPEFRPRKARLINWATKKAIEATFVGSAKGQQRTRNNYFDIWEMCTYIKLHTILTTNKLMNQK